MKANGDFIMCKILKELHGKTADYILEKYGAKNEYPVDITSIAENIGIKLGSTDFTELEKKDSLKSFVQEKGHILGSVRAKGDELSIRYHNALPNNPDFDNLSEEDKKDKLIRRQRFTIAHEIAHCCLDMPIDKDSSHIEYRTEQKDYKKDPKEIKANIFAGELLIPLNVLKDLCLIFDNKISISLFSDLFKVSRHVLEARLDYLKENGHLTDVIYI